MIRLRKQSYRLAQKLAAVTALVGGAVLVGLILMTSASITGRALIAFGLGPVPGDYELVEAGIAFAVFCFLPICQVQAGHATVDVFSSGFGRRANRALLALWEILFAAVLIFILWRLYEGALGKLRNGETTMFLQFPVWWAYGAALMPASVAAVVAVWSATDRVLTLLTGHATRHDARGAEH